MNITLNGVDAPIVLRTEKNAELTFVELDGNFQNLALKTMENDEDIRAVEAKLADTSRIEAVEADLQSAKDDTESVRGEIPDLATLTERITGLETLLDGTNLVVDDGGIVYDPNDVANKKPYFDTPVISLWNERGQFNDTMLTVTSSTTVDVDMQDYHITVSAVETETGTDFPLDDKVVVDLSKYYDEFILARRVHLNGTLIIDKGNVVNGSHLSGLTFLFYFTENDSITKIVPQSFMQFMDGTNYKDVEIFVPKTTGVKASIYINKGLNYQSLEASGFSKLTSVGDERIVRLFEDIEGDEPIIRENGIGYHITVNRVQIIGIEYGKFLNAIYQTIYYCASFPEEGGNCYSQGIEQNWSESETTAVEYYSKGKWIESGEL